MNESDSNQLKIRSIQEYLSLGYLFLIILGVIRDSVFYGFLDINIIRYSSIFDILLSPVAYITNGIIGPVFLIFAILMVYWFQQSPKIHKKYREKNWYKKVYNVEKLDKKFSKPQSADQLVFLLAAFIFFFYLGTGLGSGAKYSEQLDNAELEMGHKIVFQDKEELKVNMIGHNSLYVFYVVEKGTQVRITPVQENIKSIEKLEDKED